MNADCNRTYYAGLGENYRLLVGWPKPGQMPFTCYLTFTSATHDPAELLQVCVQTRRHFNDDGVSLVGVSLLQTCHSLRDRAARPVQLVLIRPSGKAAVKRMGRN